MSRIRERVLPLIGSGTLAILGVLIGLGAGGSILVIVLAGCIGAVMGAFLGQTAAWARAGAGAARRSEMHILRAIDVIGLESRRSRDDTAAMRDRVTRSLDEVQRASEARTIKAITAARDDVVTQQREAVRTTKQHLADRAALLEAYLQLQRLVDLPAAMPRAGTWAASEDLLLWLTDHVLASEPRLVVDLGSGQSSVWMAAALRQTGAPGRVVAIDHDAAYAEQTRRLAERQGVGRWLEVRHAPLVAVTVDGRDVEWYDPRVFDDLESIDLLSVDGPPGAGAEQARWPALPLLRDRLAPGGVVVLDDLIRRDEQEIVADWLERFPAMTVENLEFEKGAAIMRVPGAAG